MTDRMGMNDRMDEQFNRLVAPIQLSDDARNQLAGLAHEACEGHCYECQRCIPYPLQPHEDACCDDCVDIYICGCPTCTEDRVERSL